MATFPAYGPFAVGPDAMAGEGQIPTGIEAMLNPQSTPAIVNQALEAAGLRIITLRPDLLFVTLALPPRPEAAYTPAEVAAITEQLVLDNADLRPFLLADPAYAPVPKLFPGRQIRRRPWGCGRGVRSACRLRGICSHCLHRRPSAPSGCLCPDYYYAAPPGIRR